MEYLFIRLQAEQYYGDSIDEGFFILKSLYERHKENIDAITKSYGWYERAGKHSYTEVDHISVIPVTEKNLYELSMIDSNDYIEEQFDFMSEDDLELFVDNQMIRMKPKAMVSITKERYVELLDIEAAYKLIIEQ